MSGPRELCQCTCTGSYDVLMCSATAPVFPEFIEVRPVGRFALYSITSDRHVYRSYEARTLRIGRGRWTCGAADGVRVVVQAPSSGIADAGAFGASAEERLALLLTRLDDIIAEGMDIMESALELFWGLPEEPPSVEQILRSGSLEQINLFAGDGSYRLIFHDNGDLVGSHDLNLELDSDMKPYSVNFDG